MKKIIWIILVIVSAFLMYLGYIVSRNEATPNHSKIGLKQVPVQEIPHWSSTGMHEALLAFQLSCERFLQQSPDKKVGNAWLQLKIKDWYPACRQALKTQITSDDAARLFFETWFQPMIFTQDEAITGLFTGYYTPQITASLTKTEQFTVPLYATPRDLLTLQLENFDKTLPTRQLFGRLHGRQFVPYYSRQEIDQGAIENQTEVLAYIQYPSDRLFIETQGAVHLTLLDGRQMNLGYAAQNGLPYTPIGHIMLKRGLLTKKTISMQTIQAYLKKHPDEQNEIMQHNRSFVFFKILNQTGTLGTQGARLTPRVSLSVDPNWVPLGMPVWLVSTSPAPDSDMQRPLHKMMIAQDTGGAIKGTVRGDVFWGENDEASAIAGKMKNRGQYWLFVPKKQVS